MNPADALWTAPIAGSPDGQDAVLLRSASRHISDIAMRFRTLFRRLGEGLDGPGGFGDADAWYCILEGTSQIAVAETQARALVDILAARHHLPRRRRPVRVHHLDPHIGEPTTSTSFPRT
jgi:hypothetical protein